MMQKLAILILLIFLSCHNGFSQYFQFSQYDFTEHRINPALVASSDFARFTMVYRNQSASELLNIKSTSVSASYPIIGKNGGKRWSGFGVSFLDDRSGEGGIFKISEIALSYGLNIFIAHDQSLSLGLKTLHQQRRFSLHGLYTGSQYIPDRGFDLNSSPGENIDEFYNSFITFSSGIHWQKKDRYGNISAYAGLSFFDFNKPTDSFFTDESQLPSTSVINIGLNVYNEGLLSIFPEMLLTNVASKTTINIGAITTYELSDGYRSYGKLNIITRYVAGKYITGGIQLEKENYKFGFSYDIPVSSQIANNGAAEFGLEIRNLVESKYKYKSTKAKKKKVRTKKIKKSKKPKKKKRSDQEEKGIHTKGRDGNSPIDQKHEEIIIEEDISEKEEDAIANNEDPKADSIELSARAGALERTPLIPEKTVLHFNFKFESTQVDEKSTQYLKELSQILIEDPLLMVTIIGHTDASGSESYNLLLSEKRAQAVKNILISEGISPDRISIKAMGESEPLFPNDSEKGRMGNRRVEFIMFY